MLSKKLLLLSVVLLVLISYPSVAVSSEVWSRTYGGIEVEEAYSLVETSDGGYALTGNGGLFVKTDEHGDVEWTRTYEGYSLVATSDGGYALAGTKNNDFWLAKTDAQGIPEFPSWAPLLIAFVAVVAITFVYRHKLKKQGRFDGT